MVKIQKWPDYCDSEALLGFDVSKSRGRNELR
jgi:hypothetical protein